VRNDLGRRLLTSVALGIVVAMIAAAAAVVILGRPPRELRMATGAEGGMYAAFGGSLRDALGAKGYDLELVQTAGSVENAGLLREGQVDIGLVQSGVETLADTGAASALSELFYEPLWLFVREGAVAFDAGVALLDGERVAIGPPGSGTNALARAILETSAVNPVLSELRNEDAVAALAGGQVDAAFFVVAPTAPIIAQLASIPGLEIAEITRAQALSRRLPSLSPVTLYRGVLDLAADIPERDLSLLAARATLMGRDGLHPDLARLVVGVLPGILPVPLVGERDAFPSLDGTVMPVNDDARRFLAEGPTPLEAFLPFEVASPLSRVYLLVFPLLVLMFPLWTIVRAGWTWFMKSRIIGWYPRIHAIERNLDRATLPELEAQRDFLNAVVEQVASRTRVPAGYLAAYYDLRIDIAFVARQVDARIATLRAEQGLPPETGGPGLASRGLERGRADPTRITDDEMGLDPVMLD
jgi:uncharacterized protein